MNPISSHASIVIMCENRHPRIPGVTAAHYSSPSSTPQFTSANGIPSEECYQPPVMWYHILGDFSHTVLLLRAMFTSLYRYWDLHQSCFCRQIGQLFVLFPQLTL